MMRRRYAIPVTILVISLATRIYAGPMRNYTGIYHPAGGADPRYLNYGLGVAVPHLTNPRIPGPGISLTPRHHLERFIGVIPGETPYEDTGDYDDEYYAYNDNDGVVFPELVSPNRIQARLSDDVSSDEEESQTSQNGGMRTVIIYNDENDDVEDEIDDGIGNENPGEDEDDAGEEDDHFVADGVTYCRYRDRIYREGNPFSPSDDPCRLCRCTATGSICNVTICDPLPLSCLELRGNADHCCPTCLKQGCEFENITYGVGEIIKSQTTPCQTCRCEEDGHAYCTVADCIPPLCVDSIINVGECCPTCPNGPNCYTNNHTIIKSTEEWITLQHDNCTICRCRREPAGLQLWWGYRQAECKTNPRCLDQSADPH